MSFTLHGISISSGIAIGRAHLLSHAYSEVVPRFIDKNKIGEEILRFDMAVNQSRRELTDLQKVIPDDSPTEFQEFIKLHLLILEDPILSETPKTKIKELQCNAEWALKLQIETLLQKFLAIQDPYLKERKNDITQVGERILKVLYGGPKKSKKNTHEESLIVVAHDISPAEIIQFKNHRYASFITDAGSSTSHTAIIARSLNVPCIVALHDARRLIREGDLIIVDGGTGVVMVSPTWEIIREFENKNIQNIERQTRLKKIKNISAQTKDGITVQLMANVEFPSDEKLAKKNGADGIGLFRTEFLYLRRNKPPTEDEQYNIYKNLIKNVAGKPITIRTFDLGADKSTNQINTSMSLNPALGLSAIRLSLAEPKLFTDQICAILRAAKHGTIKILIPMIMNLHEMDEVIKSIQKCKNVLLKKGIPHDASIQIGAMIEVPAAAFIMDSLGEYFDFFAIGTNDLIQYTLAVDRTDDAVAHLYDPTHPAVINLLKIIVEKATKINKPISLCGEIAGDESLTRILLGLGITSLSMHPANLLKVKESVINADISIIKKLIDEFTSDECKQKRRTEILNLINES